MGYKAGLLSTIENKIGDRVIGSTHTTPDPVQINRLMQQMLEEGCTYCFMEVSSHAVHQHRVAGLEFNGGIFTNLTQDHLDYHKTFEEYLKAKKQFFDELDPSAFALVNLDDRNGAIMLQNTKAAKKKGLSAGRAGRFTLGHASPHHPKTSSVFLNCWPSASSAS